MHTIMIGRQLDLFGGPLKPPKNIVVEEEPEVKVPETVPVMPEPELPETGLPDAEPLVAEPLLVAPETEVTEPAPVDNEPEVPGFLTEEPPQETTEDPSPEVIAVSEQGEIAELLKEEAGVHVQMPPSDYFENSILPAEVEPAAEQEPETFSLTGLEEDYTLEEAIAAELVAADSSVSEGYTGNLEEEEEPKVQAQEENPTEWVPELPDSEFYTDEEIAEPVYPEPPAEPGFLSEIPVDEPETEAPALLSVESLEEEPDWVNSELPDSEPELSAEVADQDEDVAVLPVIEPVSEDLIGENEEEPGEQSPEIAVEAPEADAADLTEVGPLNIPADKALYSRQYYTMRETANMFNVNQSLLRFWENEFDILKPKKNRKGDRYFRPEDIKNLELIYHLLRVRKFTISGAKDYLKNKAKSLDTFAMVQRLEKLKLFLQELKTHA